MSAGSAAISPQTESGLRAACAAAGDLRDEAQDRGMRRPEEVRDGLVRAVHGERVLDEVVRPEREEVGLGSEEVGRDRRRRDLDHRADRDVVRDGDPPREDVLARLLHELADAPELLDARDHRDEDPEVARVARRRAARSAAS